MTFPVKYPYYIVVFDLQKKGYTKMIHIRLASKDDIQNIMPLYAYARKFMAANGNPHQWNGNYPASEDILKDIANGNYYVCTPENAPEKIVGGFAFIIGREPNYAVIENGAWHSDQPYGTIHRIASNGQVKGIARACFDFCHNKIDCLRIDTHADNKPMQNAIGSYGFRYCGIIHVADGTPRNAYDLV